MHKHICSLGHANPPNSKFSSTTKEISRDIPERDGSLGGTLEANDAPPDGDRNRLRPIAGAEFVHDVLEVTLHSSFGYEQAVRDVSVAVALGYLLQDLYFPHGECLVTHVVGKMGGILRRDGLFASMHLADCFENFPGRHAVEYVAFSSAHQRTLHFHVTFGGRNHDDSGLRGTA